jgi:PE family
MDMSYVIAAPEIMISAAADLAGLGSTLSAAHAAAAAPTTGIVVAAGDEGLAAIAAVFAAHGQGFQALGAQAAVRAQFVQLLQSGGSGDAAAQSAAYSDPRTALGDLAQSFEIFSRVEAPTGRSLFVNGANAARER